MLYAPHGILRILRSAKSLNSRFTATLPAFLTAHTLVLFSTFLKYNLFRTLKRLKRVSNCSNFIH